VWLRIAFGMQSLFWMMVTGIANSPYFWKKCWEIVTLR
jgi:hypothetical protein